MDQYYPQDKLEVIVVDDCSTDNSAKVIRETIQDIIDQEGSEVASRISYILQPVNKGKREALALGAKHAQHELLVFVDSDSFLNPYAIINLVQPFKDEQVAVFPVVRMWPIPIPIPSPRCSLSVITLPFVS